MRRAERLFRLVNQMRAFGVSTADKLAAELEVSTRTIYRDIAHLQASGLPIKGEAGVGYLLRPGFDLPSMTVTLEQVDALAVGLSFAESLDDPQLAAAAREVRAKIQATLPAPEARKLVDTPYFSLRHPTGAPKYAGPIRTQRIVQLTYANGAGQSSQRRVQPLAIWNFTEGWMFSAWCDLRQSFRTFRFDRILHLAATDDPFDNDAAKGLHAFMDLDHCETRAP